MRRPDKLVSQPEQRRHGMLLNRSIERLCLLMKARAILPIRPRLALRRKLCLNLRRCVGDPAPIEKEIFIYSTVCTAKLNPARMLLSIIRIAGTGRLHLQAQLFEENP